MKRQWSSVVSFFILMAAVFSSTAFSKETQGSTIIPEPVPKRFGIPGDRNEIQYFTNKNNVKKIRQHAWEIWAGLTADSQSSYHGEVLPIWETWLATSQVFQDPPKTICENCDFDPHVRPAREYRPPHQFLHGAANIAGEGKQITNPTSLVGFNKFEPSEVRFLWTLHEQNGHAFNYTNYDDLVKLNNSWPNNTPIKKAAIIDTPASSIELKPVLFLVEANKLTAIPFWQGPRASAAPNCSNVNVNTLRHPTGRINPTNCHPDPSTWTHCVLVDASNPVAKLRAATLAEFKKANLTQAPECTVANAQYIGIDALYHFKLDKTEAKAFNQFQGSTKAKKGDRMALVAMHVSTKEIITWTWQTFWWQAGQETPNNYPGSGKLRPTSGTFKINSPWDNYNMCAAYAQTTQAVGDKGEMNVCFNPYLETSTGIPDGLRSNCVSCHGTAAFNLPPSGGYPLTYAKPVDFDYSIQYFLCSTKTDFSYAIQGNAANAPAKPPAWSCDRR